MAPVASGSRTSSVKTEEFSWLCSECQPPVYYPTTGTVQSHRRKAHIHQTLITVGSKVYRVWRKDGVFTCPLCQHGSPFPAYLRDHLNSDRPTTGKCDLVKMWSSADALPDNWELMPASTTSKSVMSSSGGTPTARARAASASFDGDERSAKKLRETPTRAQPQRMQVTASSSSAAAPSSSSPVRQQARASIAPLPIIPTAAPIAQATPSPAPVEAKFFPFKLPPTSASLSPDERAQAQKHIDALNRIFDLLPADVGGSGSDRPPGDGDRPMDETPVAEPAKAPESTTTMEARLSWFKPSTWF